MDRSLHLKDQYIFSLWKSIFLQHYNQRSTTCIASETILLFGTLNLLVQWSMFRSSVKNKMGRSRLSAHSTWKLESEPGLDSSVAKLNETKNNDVLTEK